MGGVGKGGACLGRGSHVWVEVSRLPDQVGHHVDAACQGLHRLTAAPTHPPAPPPCSGYSIWMLRMVTSCEIKRRADFFAPFIMVSAC